MRAPACEPLDLITGVLSGCETLHLWETPGVAEADAMLRAAVTVADKGAPNGQRTHTFSSPTFMGLLRQMREQVIPRDSTPTLERERRQADEEQRRRAAPETEPAATPVPTPITSPLPRLRAVNLEPVGTGGRTLAELEAVFARRDDYMSSGTALAAIRDNKLFPATSPTFVEYLRKRWSLSKESGYVMIAVAAVARILTAAGFRKLPANVHAARELSHLRIGQRLDAERILAAWTLACEDGPPTTRTLRQAVQRVRAIRQPVTE